MGGDVIDLRLGDCLGIMPTLAENSVNLIAVDPPYYKVKGEAWDRQWENPQKFLEWIGRLCRQWQRLLKPNGSLYVFASPKMAARVECKVAEYFNILNHIIWLKDENGTRRHEAQLIDKGLARSYFPDNERIIFAEHYGSDNIAKGEAGYAAKCDQLRGFIFEPLRKYLDDERKRAGLTPEDVNEILGFRRAGGMAGRHYFSQSQWCLPTSEHYHKMRDGFSQCDHGGQYLRREYEDLRREYEDLRREYEDLRREYEDLRREYEDLRRPFSVSADVPYTDVWTFPTVLHYEGQHPCEKPLAMMEHIIRTSSREGDTVLDCCMGSGVAGEAAWKLNRNFIGMDSSEHWVRFAQKRIAEVQRQMILL